MDWNNVICKSCGLINDYKIQERSGQLVCNCNGCGNFLGNKPRQVDLRSVTMPFGKYKDERVTELNDLNYIRWVYENCNVKGNLKKAIEFKLNVKVNG